MKKIKINEGYLDTTGIVHEKGLLSTFLASIIETGNNDNGEYIKFSNGYMICLGTGKGVNGTYTTVTFPMSFKDTDYRFVGNVSQDSTQYANGIKRGGKTTNSIKIYMWYIDVTTGKGGMGANDFDYIAIGKWK